MITESSCSVYVDIFKLIDPHNLDRQNYNFGKMTFYANPAYVWRGKLINRSPDNNRPSTVIDPPQ